MNLFKENIKNETYICSAVVSCNENGEIFLVKVSSEPAKTCDEDQSASEYLEEWDLREFDLCQKPGLYLCDIIAHTWCTDTIDYGKEYDATLKFENVNCLFECK